MKNSKGMWYFRSSTAIADDDDLASILVPVDQLTGFTPGSNSATASTEHVTIHYKSNASSTTNTHDGVPTQNGFITLEIVDKKQFEVMSVLAAAAASNNTVTQVIWDQATSEALDGNITGISKIANI